MQIMHQLCKSYIRISWWGGVLLIPLVVISIGVIINETCHSTVPLVSTKIYTVITTVWFIRGCWCIGWQ